MRLDTNRAGVGLLPRARHPRASSLVSQPRCSEVLHGGRTWWAHFEFTRINIELTILPKKIEDLREAHITRALSRRGTGSLDAGNRLSPRSPP